MLKEFETLDGDVVFIEPSDIVYLVGFGNDCTHAYVRGVAADNIYLKGSIRDVAQFVRRAVEFHD